MAKRYHVWFRPFRASGQCGRFDRMDTKANSAPHGDDGFRSRGEAEEWAKKQCFGHGSLWIDAGCGPNRH